MANIDTELETINTDLYGKNVKEAIHDGLYALNQEQVAFLSQFDELKDKFSQLPGGGDTVTYPVWLGTKQEYDELPSHDPNIVYFIKEPTIDVTEALRTAGDS